MVDLNIVLPEGFLEEEVRCDYTVTRQMKEVWAVELDLLAELQRVCDKYGIAYFADGGTMLGAVRHKGFIPWDDDIDIVMTRDNYQKLCEIAETEFNAPYFFQTDYTDPGSNRGHAQLRNLDTTGILLGEEGGKYKFNQGIFIDIFPLDYLPDDPLKRKEYIASVEKQFNGWKNYYKYTLRYWEASNIVKRTIKVVIHKIMMLFHIRCKHNLKFKKFEDFVKKNDETKTSYVAKLFFNNVEDRYIWKSSWFENYQLMPFEMLNIPVSTNYEDIMNTFFGEWKKPICQPSTHGGAIFDTGVSYIEYLKEK